MAHPDSIASKNGNTAGVRQTKMPPTPKTTLTV